MHPRTHTHTHTHTHTTHTNTNTHTHAYKYTHIHNKALARLNHVDDALLRLSREAERQVTTSIFISNNAVNNAVLPAIAVLM
jgi:hypothetical protein